MFRTLTVILQKKFKFVCRPIHPPLGHIASILSVSTRSFERTAAPHPAQAVVFTFREIEFLSKNLSLVRSVSTRLSGFFEKFRKNGGGHHALGSPRVGSIFALVQRRSLLSPKCCRKHMNTTNNKFSDSKTCEQGMQRLFIDVRGLNIYSRIKQAQVFDVPCIGDDPPILVLDLVCPWSEHLVDDERPLPWRRKLVPVLAALNSSEHKISDVELAGCTLRSW
jgi:hypothetical protein